MQVFGKRCCQTIRKQMRGNDPPGLVLAIQPLIASVLKYFLSNDSSAEAAVNREQDRGENRGKITQEGPLPIESELEHPACSTTAPQGTMSATDKGMG